MFSRSWLNLSAVVMLFITNGLSAQNITIQQPAFGVTSVATTVSVPDRGSALLGGISRARTGRKSYGIFRSGTSTGIERDHVGMRTHVYIHDFEAMDRYLLSVGTTRLNSVSDDHVLTGPAAYAYRQLLANNRSRTSSRDLRSSGGISSARNSGRQITYTPPGKSSSARYLKLAERAERQGKTSLARLHYRMAAKKGSQTAAARLKALGAIADAGSVNGPQSTAVISPVALPRR